MPPHTEQGTEERSCSSHPEDRVVGLDRWLENVTVRKDDLGSLLTLMSLAPPRRAGDGTRESAFWSGSTVSQTPEDWGHASETLDLTIHRGLFTKDSE